MEEFRDYKLEFQILEDLNEARYLSKHRKDNYFDEKGISRTEVLFSSSKYEGINPDRITASVEKLLQYGHVEWLVPQPPILDALKNARIWITDYGRTMLDFKNNNGEFSEYMQSFIKEMDSKFNKQQEEYMRSNIVTLGWFAGIFSLIVGNVKIINDVNDPKWKIISFFILGVLLLVFLVLLNSIFNRRR